MRQKRGISPKELVNEFHERHKEDFDGFEISFDEFYTTDSPENQRHCEIIYLRAQERGHIDTTARLSSTIARNAVVSFRIGTSEARARSVGRRISMVTSARYAAQHTRPRTWSTPGARYVGQHRLADIHALLFSD